MIWHDWLALVYGIGFILTMLYILGHLVHRIWIRDVEHYLIVVEIALAFVIGAVWPILPLIILFVYCVGEYDEVDDHFVEKIR